MVRERFVIFSVDGIKSEIDALSNDLASAKNADRRSVLLKQLNDLLTLVSDSDHRLIRQMMLYEYIGSILSEFKKLSMDECRKIKIGCMTERVLTDLPKCPVQCLRILNVLIEKLRHENARNVNSETILNCLVPLLSTGYPFPYKDLCRTISKVPILLSNDYIRYNAFWNKLLNDFHNKLFSSIMTTFPNFNFNEKGLVEPNEKRNAKWLIRRYFAVIGCILAEKTIHCVDRTLVFSLVDNLLKLVDQDIDEEITMQCIHIFYVIAQSCPSVLQSKSTDLVSLFLKGFKSEKFEAITLKLFIAYVSKFGPLSGLDNNRDSLLSIIRQLCILLTTTRNKDNSASALSVVISVYSHKKACGCLLDDLGTICHRYAIYTEFMQTSKTHSVAFDELILTLSMSGIHFGLNCSNQRNAIAGSLASVFMPIRSSFALESKLLSSELKVAGRKRTISYNFSLSETVPPAKKTHSVKNDTMKHGDLVVECKERKPIDFVEKKRKDSEDIVLLADSEEFISVDENDSDLTVSTTSQTSSLSQV
ncbi:hypothetical protein ACOME3_007220 [Neoechinorhynchus agilis]